MAAPQITLHYQQLAALDLPSEVEGLYELAYNLWWSWQPEAQQLFSAIDSWSWSRYRNPVEVLRHMDRERWAARVADETFLESYREVYESYRRYRTRSAETWFAQSCGELETGPIAYVSPEFGVDRCLAMYSGGLGILAGDHCKAASDLGVPLVAVGLLYRHGYFRQSIDADGYQQHTFPAYNFARLPVRPVAANTGQSLMVQVPLPDRELAVKVWGVEVGRVPVLLLDTDLALNHPADRFFTQTLYVGGRVARLLQELVLGIGAVKVLRALEIEPVAWHYNEGHSALGQLERLRHLVHVGLTAAEALEQVRKTTVFTTHTPVLAGNETFERPLVERYLGPWAPQLGLAPQELLELGHADHGARDQPFNLTAFALRTARFANAVSGRNAQVCEAMWHHLRPAEAGSEPWIRPITNGVHGETWIGVDLMRLFQQRLGLDWVRRLAAADGLAALEGISDQELWRAHLLHKQRLARFLRGHLREQSARHGKSPDELRRLDRLFDPDALTIGFARRFATYKRADLLFRDRLRLQGLLGAAGRPVQVVLAGKAHPADRPGQSLIRQIFLLSQEPSLFGRVFFLENYDMEVGRVLVPGADVWLNTPRRPLEACGTTGQKASLNGVLHCSVLDGWWQEAWDGSYGWAIGDRLEPDPDEGQQDEADAEALYQVLEHRVVPAFYDRDPAGLPREWLAQMRRAIVAGAGRFSAERMVKDYVRLGYLPACANTRAAQAPADRF